MYVRININLPHDLDLTKWTHAHAHTNMADEFINKHTTAKCALIAADYV